MNLNEYVTLEVPLAVTLAASDLQEYEFDGYASVFGVVNSYGFTIDAGAFAKTLKENPNPPLLWQHDSWEPIGIIASAEEDKKGLKIRGQLVPAVDRANAAYELMKVGALKGLSIGFYPMKSTYESGKGVDHITEAKLREVSVVTFPADPKAQVSRVLSALHTLSPDAMRRGDYTAAITSLQALLAGQPGEPTAPVTEPQSVEPLRALLSELNATLRSVK